MPQRPRIIEKESNLLSTQHFHCGRVWTRSYRLTGHTLATHEAMHVTMLLTAFTASKVHDGCVNGTNDWNAHNDSALRTCLYAALEQDP